MRIALATIVMLLSLSTVVDAAPKKTGDELVQTKLLANVSSVEPGKSFTIGVVFKIDPGWHIYWLNPGDAGLPTQVSFDLPPAFAVGDLKFPIPERIVEAGDIVSYGYHNEVMLIATITAPKDLKIGETIKIVAKTNWLVCEKICLPGSAQATIELIVGEKSSSANAEIFETWTRRLPLAGDQVSAADAHFSAPIDFSKGDSSIDLASSKSIDLAIPGPLDGATVILTKPKRDSHGSVVTLGATPLPGQTISAKFMDVLLIYTSNGERQAYDLKIPIVGSAPAKLGPTNPR